MRTEGRRRKERETDLFLVVQTLVIVFQGGEAFLAARYVVGRRVDDVAGEQLLPEGEAAGGALGTLVSLVGRGEVEGWFCGCGGIEGRG